MNLLAIDFETANGSSASACSIGCALWVEGEIIDNREILIRPHQSVGFFQYGNMKIHHITPTMVKNCPEWPDVFCDIAGLFENSLVVAHNALFDIGVLRSLNQLYGIEMNDFPYIDTVTVSRIIHPFLPNHKLNTVCEYLNFDFSHHQANSDALGCIAIMEDAMNLMETYDVEELIDRLKKKKKWYSGS